MAVFKLLRGMHAEGKGAERRVYKRGAMIDSDIELEKRFGSQKFRKMGDSSPKVARAKAAPEPEEEVVEDDDLEDMTVMQLKELAENEEINIEGLKVKADIVERIRESR